MAFRPLGQPRCLKQRHEPAHLSAGAMWDSRCDAPATSLLPCSIPSNGLVLSPWGWHGGSGRCVAAELFPLALGALHPWFHPSTVSEQNVPIIYFPTHRVTEDVCGFWYSVPALRVSTQPCSTSSW